MKARAKAYKNVVHWSAYQLKEYKMHPINCRYGDMVIEWDDSGNLTLTRQSDGTRIYISVSEWNALLVIIQLKGWPVAPPYPVAPPIGQ